MNPSLPRETVDRFVRNGYKYSLCRFYSSAVTEEEFNDLVRMVNNAPIFCTEIIYIYYREKQNTTKSRIKKHFVDGKLIIHTEKTAGYLHGAYLILAVPMWDEKYKDFIFCLDVLAGYIRVVYGKAAVEDCHLQLVYDLQNDKHSITAATLVDQDRRLWDEARSVFRESSVSLRLGSRAAEVVSRAHSEADGTLRFILYWLAFEAQTGKAKERKRFEAELNSAEVSKELTRLRDLRSRCLHDVEKVTPTFFDEFSIVSLLRISACTNDTQRIQLKSLYEAALIEPLDERRKLPKPD